MISRHKSTNLRPALLPPQEAPRARIYDGEVRVCRDIVTRDVGLALVRNAHLRGHARRRGAAEGIRENAAAGATHAGGGPPRGYGRTPRRKQTDAPHEPERDEAKLEYGGIFPEGRRSSSSTQTHRTHARTQTNKQTAPHSPPARGRIPP